MLDVQLENFILYKKRKTFLNLTGSDIRNDLIEKAKIKVSEVSFLKKMY